MLVWRTEGVGGVSAPFVLESPCSPKMCVHVPAVLIVSKHIFHNQDENCLLCYYKSCPDCHLAERDMN